MERGKILELIEKEATITFFMKDGEKHTGVIFYISNPNEGDCLIKLKDSKNQWLTTSLKKISHFQSNLEGF